LASTLITSADPVDERASDPEPSRSGIFIGRAITGFLVIGPAVALGITIPLLWGSVVHLHDIVLAVAFYLLSGFGVTIGYHRLFTHRSFKPRRGLKILLASAGSLAMEGSLIGWVANHRRHHVFSDRPGDPHSPHEFDGTGFAGPLRGFAHAHIGWLFRVNATSAERFAPDLVRDADVAIISRLFPLFAVFSLAAPFFLGWAWSGTIGGALTALLWAGGARMMLLHHVTWSVNSICHMFGKQPATDKDKSTNFAPLGVLSFGEAWHNFHHAHPRSARHGALPHQMDPSAAIIRLFERAGWATEVRWPTLVQIAACSPKQELVTTQ
jgi:stearoyl-CoA desaturase (delta-9 desaturase)